MEKTRRCETCDRDLEIDFRGRERCLACDEYDSVTGYHLTDSAESIIHNDAQKINDSMRSKGVRP